MGAMRTPPLPSGILRLALYLVAVFSVASCVQQESCPLVTEQDKRQFAEVLQARPLVRVTVLSMVPSRIYRCGVAVRWTTSVSMVTLSSEGRPTTTYCGSFEMAADFPRNSFGEVAVAASLPPYWSDTVRDIQAFAMMSRRPSGAPR
ncbi:hypothetical protein MAMC_01433 [Methylacidimicrobium cyclopophantes]|uniref:Uncharacterized protein n=1 Tax=Methylacidimicrobium cyclopophantes TaxID=1041766 RepID=A0A5E6MFS1_9BACT|nr:hypothetical protein [Methylacidimicrobium cyclopophantes]VVM07093.1 hypothetical protein MAMC_01433 [Methylacidimicrobium cyclopophantes]